MYKQMKGVNFRKDHVDLMTELLVNSLFLVQEEFNEDLPLNKHALAFYLQQKYLEKIEN